jgi:sterol desaturase/sphingolipid hydroxylase (fatty acid hydroxylase superfamily)
MTIMNVMGHLGYEIFPKGFINSSIGKWQNTSTNHNIHHQESNYNFGLYFTFWDRIMGTYRPQ